jgi:hypothetical protein
MNPSERGALTPWGTQTEGQVRTRNESEQARGTHTLESADRGTSQDTERIRASEGHSLSGERRPRDKSGHGMNPTNRGALTLWRAQTAGQVRTRKESEQTRGTHILESADRGTSQDTRRIRASDGHSLSGERRPRDKSGHGKNPSERRALTNWRAQTEGQVRTRKESERPRGTHFLESADRGTSQDAE